MNAAYKFRIYPDKVQRELMGKTFGCVRFLYNRMLEDKISFYKENARQLKNTPAQYKNKFPFLKEVDSLSLANAQLHLQTAFRNFFQRKDSGYPRFKKRKYGQSYTTNLVNGNIVLDGGYLTLPKLGKVRIKQHREIPAGYSLKSVTVSITPAGEYYASILYAYSAEIKEINTDEITDDKILGIDFSMKELAKLSDGSSAEYPRYYRISREKLAREQRKLSGCQKGSKSREKQRRKVAKLHEKISRQRRDFIHNKSRQITNAYDVVCVEDLNMKGMSQALNFGMSVHDNGFGIFVNQLEYKLKNEGKKLVRVNRWYASSKTCCVCGKKKKEMPLQVRTFQCECGNVMDRDLNAAINIKNEGKRLFKEQLSA